MLADGVDTTEGEGGTGFYFGYYSIGEFTTTAAGADVQMTAPGSLVMMTMKSGGNDWSGMFHGDYEHESFVGENIDDALASRDYTGNPNLPTPPPTPAVPPGYATTSSIRTQTGSTTALTNFSTSSARATVLR